MNKSDININCPECGTAIDVDEILYHQLEDQIKKQYQNEISALKKDFESKQSSLEEQKKRLDEESAKLNEKIQDGIKSKLIEEKAIIAEKLKKQLQKENEERFNYLQRELNEKSEKIKDLNKAQIEIERLKREKANLREEIELESQKIINQQLQVEKEKISKLEAQRNELKISEKEKIINQLKEQLNEAQRKAEQGSGQLQGEVQELAIEEWLSAQFPYDEIKEIKKGVRGGDCLQIVNTVNAKNCGTIYYESKRTKDFQPRWIEKFKNDIRDKAANIGVLVTDVLPKDVDRMTLIDGIWVCTYQEFKGLCFVLRENIIAISRAISTQENKGDKMVMLYDFLTSNEFKLQIEAIVEGFTQMEHDLLAEKRSMQGHWKKREKQIQKVLLNTNYMYNSIKGIAGNAIKSIQMLELPENDGLDE